tara:strand:- start:200 stop:835 length:636 start_codon:yes stop_codon:yes gene_type:complete
MVQIKETIQMARTKSKRTPSVSQINAEIAKQVTALRAHESNLQQQLNEIQTMITSFGGQSSSVTPTKRRGRKAGSKNKTAKSATATKTIPKSLTPKRGRPKGSPSKKQGGISLSDAIQKSMRKGKNCTISDMKEGIAKVGYTSSAKNFSVIINQTLGRLMKQGVIVRVDRGVYVRRGQTTSIKVSKPSAPIKEETPEVVATSTGSVEEWKS